MCFLHATATMALLAQKAQIWSSVTFVMPFFLILFPSLEDLTKEAWRAHRSQRIKGHQGFMQHVHFCKLLFSTELIFLENFNCRFHFLQLAASLEIVVIR